MPTGLFPQGLWAMLYAVSVHRECGRFLPGQNLASQGSSGSTLFKLGEWVQANIHCKLSGHMPVGQQDSISPQQLNEGFAY